MQNRTMALTNPYKLYNTNKLTLVFCIILVNLNHCANSQIADTIFKSYTEINSKRIDSIINFNKQKDNYKYLAILPTVSYNAIDNSFGVGINFSNFSNYFQNKKRNEIEVEKLRFQLLESHHNNLENLQNQYELILNSLEILRIEIDNTKLSKEIFNLKKSQYDNNKITLETWLNVQNDYQKSNLLLFAKRKNLIAKMKQYQLKIKSPCFRQELEYLSINLTNQ